MVEKTVKLPAVFQLIDPPSDKGFDIDLTAMKIRGRGNSTWVMPKKPYRVDFPQETSLFGLPKAKKMGAAGQLPGSNPDNERCCIQARAHVRFGI